MKLIFANFIKVKALVLSAALLLAGQTNANAGHESPRLSPAQAQRLSRDLVQFNSQDFFRKGNNSIDREIQILRQRQFSPTEPVLKINSVPQTEKDRLPSNSPNVLPK